MNVNLLRKQCIHQENRKDYTQRNVTETTKVTEVVKDENINVRTTISKAGSSHLKLMADSC